MPPLRERLECIEPLAQYLLEKLSRSVKKKIDSFTPDVIEIFRQYSWPGNIRQLSNTIERALLLEDERVIRPQSISLPDFGDKLSPNLQEVGLRLTEDQEKDLISNALEENLWIQKDAARRLGITPRALNYRIKKLGITHSRWRKNR
jgi:transcriptional regulator with PAS, ATPase and Fis domain